VISAEIIQAFIPTIILTTIMPTLSALLTGFAIKLTELENYETTDGEYFLEFIFDHADTHSL
jgi:hypothetical protein